MTALLTFIIVLFVAVAMWQMVKIFDLAQVGASNNQIADDKDNRVNGYLMMGFLVFIYAITIASFMYLGDLPLVCQFSLGSWIRY
jgi:cytochrome c oxidase subunit 2